MFKISFPNSIFYLLAKYFVFFFILAFLEDRFKSAVMDNSETSAEFIKFSLGYLLYITLANIFLTLIFCAPLYYILKVRTGIYCLLLFITFYGIEYFAYSQLMSPSDNIIGLYNLTIGICILPLFFLKELKKKFSHVSPDYKS
jgi:hypothetical protein